MNLEQALEEINFLNAQLSFYKERFNSIQQKLQIQQQSPYTICSHLRRLDRSLNCSFERDRKLLKDNLRELRNRIDQIIL